ncbi:MAG: TPM domain-containing protein [Candidatus Omnitrophota bacterium]
MKKILFIVSLVIFIFPATVWVAEIPKPVGWVNDFAGVISQEYRDKMTDVIKDLRDNTSAEIFVVTVPSMAPYDEKAYARMLFDNWKPGVKGKDNGVLVFLAVKERRWRIETGYGVEGVLPDGKCGDIGRAYMVPYFKVGKYGEGLYRGVSVLSRIITKDENVASDNSGVPVLQESAGVDESDASVFMYIIFGIFSIALNLPWSIFVGLSLTLFFAAIFYNVSPFYAFSIIIGCVVSQIYKYSYWNRLSPGKRGRFLKYKNNYPSGGWGSGGLYSGGFGGGGFGGGGFGGGGCGGGGGAGGGF